MSQFQLITTVTITLCCKSDDGVASFSPSWNFFVTQRCPNWQFLAKALHDECRIIQRERVKYFGRLPLIPVYAGLFKFDPQLERINNY